MKNLFATRWGIIGVGAGIGILAALLQYFGNPANMGVCVACFVRDITGAVAFTGHTIFPGNGLQSAGSA